MYNALAEAMRFFRVDNSQKVSHCKWKSKKENFKDNMYIAEATGTFLFACMYM